MVGRLIKENETGRAVPRNKPWSGCTCTAVMPYNTQWFDELLCGKEKKHFIFNC
jgi:hypothetical protein